MKMRKMTNRSKGMALSRATSRAFGSRIIFEDFLRQQIESGHMNFRLHAQMHDDVVTVIIKPDVIDMESKDTPTFLGYVMRSGIEPKTAIDNIIKYFKQEVKPERSI